MENKTIEQLERDLIEIRSELKKAEYDLRWGGFKNPMDYISSSQYTVVSYWRNRESEVGRTLREKGIYG
jgi:hypothetical protein